MANTTALYTRIDTSLKNRAEDILAKLGITPSSAIQMFYSQIILHRGLPFESKLPAAKPVAIGSMTREELDAELSKGLASFRNGAVMSADDVDDIMKREITEE